MPWGISTSKISRDSVYNPGEQYSQKSESWVISSSDEEMPQRKTITEQAKIKTWSRNLSHAHSLTSRKIHVSNSVTCWTGWKDTHVFQYVSRHLQRQGRGSTTDIHWGHDSGQAVWYYAWNHQSCSSPGLITINTTLHWWGQHCFQK